MAKKSKAMLAAEKEYAEAHQAIQRQRMAVAMLTQQKRMLVDRLMGCDTCLQHAVAVQDYLTERLTTLDRTIARTR